MNLRTSGIVVGAVALAAVVGAGAFYWSMQRTGSGNGQDIGYAAMPAGITLQPLGAAQGYGPQKYTTTVRPEIVYANEKGLTLYTYEKDEAGKSNCTGDCTKDWIPAHPLSNAKPTPNWSVISRDDGAKQWAHGGKPLYISAKDTEGGEVMGLGDPVKKGQVLKPTIDAFAGLAFTAVLPAAWHMEKFQTNDVPVTGLTPPLGFAIKEVTDANAVVILDSQEKTVYTYSGDVNNDVLACGSLASTDCASFTPVAAPVLARPSGDWTFVTRKDGVKQWAYKGKPLYTYDRDTIPGDINGTNTDPRWRVAAIEQYYRPPNVTFRDNPGRGLVLAAADGRTLYRRDVNTYLAASVQVAHGKLYRPRIGRMIRDVACDAECAKTWHPYLAPADAQPNGYWGVAVLADGSKQWTYKDFALFTYDGDKKAGDITGDSIYDVYLNDDPNISNEKGFPTFYHAGFFWTFATL